MYNELFLYKELLLNTTNEVLHYIDSGCFYIKNYY